jgi:hypothetical protein
MEIRPNHLQPLPIQYLFTSCCFLPLFYRFGSSARRYKSQVHAVSLFALCRTKGLIWPLTTHVPLQK